MSLSLLKAEIEGLFYSITLSKINNIHYLILSVCSHWIFSIGAIEGDR